MCNTVHILPVVPFHLSHAFIIINTSTNLTVIWYKAIDALYKPHFEALISEWLYISYKMAWTEETVSYLLPVCAKKKA